MTEPTTTRDKQHYFALGAFCAIVTIATMLTIDRRHRSEPSPDRDVTKAERDFVYDCMRFKTGSPEECRDVAAELFDGACPEPEPRIIELDENGKAVAP